MTRNSRGDNTPLKCNRRQFLSTLTVGSAVGLSALTGCPPTSNKNEAPVEDPTLPDLRTTALALRTRYLSPIHLTQACLDRIARLDSKLHAFITVSADAALTAARKAEIELARGEWRGPLHGIPIAVKDNIDTAGIPTTCGSKVFADRVPNKDAEVVRCLKAAGAIVLGKLNMHEFALGTTSAISAAGPVHNPWNLDYVAGGSSGGCGAAVAAHFCFGVVGSDTGGSIRIPAAACGIVGLKPTYDVVSQQGLFISSRLFDHVGPMCRTVADTALLFRAMTDHAVSKEYDPDSPPPVKGLRVGVLKADAALCELDCSAEVQATFDAALQVLRGLVAEVRSAELPMVDIGRLIDAEVYAAHAPYVTKTPQLYDARSLAAILEGKDLPPAKVTDWRRRLAAHRASAPKVFADVDLVVAPTLPTSPIPIANATAPFALSACTFAFSAAGWPCISVPCGFSKEGLPISMQIAGPPYAEARIFALAEAYERATDWHRRQPTIG